MKVRIRPATTEDRPTIEAASRETWDAHRARQPDAFAENGWDMKLRRDHEIAFRDANALPLGESGNLFVAEADGDVVGFALLSWHLRADAPDHHKGSINDIWVHPGWRKRGIAAELVSFAKDMADAAGWDDLTAQVWEGAPSATLFEQAGFARRSTIWRYGPDRPARPIEARPEVQATQQALRWWTWAILAAILALFIVVALSG